MARVFITGSSDGLGLLSAKSLIEQGHGVALHARNAQRRQDTLKKISGAEAVLVGDLSDIDETRQLANEVNSLGIFDAIIHNAGVYQASSKEMFTVNTLAPYILTCLIRRPQRLIYLSSGMQLQGTAKLDYFKANIDRVNYSDTKLHVLMLSMAIARKWPDVYSNTVNPGWVPTKMGGQGAPDDLHKGYETQLWLATSNDNGAKVSGRYFFHRKEARYNAEAGDVQLQERFMNACKELTGVSLV